MERRKLAKDTLTLRRHTKEVVQEWYDKNDPIEEFWDIEEYKNLKKVVDKTGLQIIMDDPMLEFYDL